MCVLAKPVNVGWGHKSTQFHGSAGKHSAKEQPVRDAGPALTWDDLRPRVSWRGDGEYFVCSCIEPASGPSRTKEKKTRKMWCVCVVLWLQVGGDSESGPETEYSTPPARRLNVWSTRCTGGLSETAQLIFLFTSVSLFLPFLPYLALPLNPSPPLSLSPSRSISLSPSRSISLSLPLSSLLPLSDPVATSSPPPRVSLTLTRLSSSRGMVFVMDGSPSLRANNHGRSAQLPFSPSFTSHTSLTSHTSHTSLTSCSHTSLISLSLSLSFSRCVSCCGIVTRVFCVCGWSSNKLRQLPLKTALSPRLLQLPSLPVIPCTTALLSNNVQHLNFERLNFHGPKVIHENFVHEHIFWQVL